MVGSSTGALISLHVVQRQPGLIDHIILLSPAIDLAKYFTDAAARYSWNEENPEASNNFMPNGFASLITFCTFFLAKKKCTVPFRNVVTLRIGTSDGSGALRLSFLRDCVSSSLGVAPPPGFSQNPNTPCLLGFAGVGVAVVHAVQDELVPVDLVRQYCETHRGQGKYFSV